jgi:hypothetical protein
MNTGRIKTNREFINRLYNVPASTFVAQLTTPHGMVQVTITKEIVIDILREIGRDSPCPCRIRVRQGVGYIFPLALTPPPSWGLRGSHAS